MRSIKIFCLAAVLALFTCQFVYAQPQNAEKKKITIEDLRGAYKELYDKFNTTWSDESIPFISNLVAAQAAEGNSGLAALLAQYLELVMSDGYHCAIDSRQRSLVTSKSDYYRNVKNECIMYYPSSEKQKMMNVLQEAKNYYYSTKTRASGFKDSCRKKILSAKR